MIRVRWKVALVLTMAVLVSGPVPYTAPSGDLNLDGVSDVVDLQCLIQTYQFATAAGFPEEDLCNADEDCLAVSPEAYCRPGLNKYKVCLHHCLDSGVGLYPDPGVVCDPEAEENEFCLGVTQKRSADMNCDGLIGNEDFNFIVQVIMNQAGGLDTADLDGDGQLNYCDDDMDGTQSMPAVPGPGTNGGGELNCAKDPNHSITPGNYGDDTSASSHQCKDNSQLFMLYVYTDPGATPICDAYKIETSNGVY